MKQQVVIIGGGIAGLSAAYALQQGAQAQGQSIAYTLLESSPRLGGKIVSEEAGEFLIEGGPDSFLQQKPWAAQLACQLGLESELIGTNPVEKRLYVLNHGRLVQMPDGVMLIIPTRFLPFVTSPLISWGGKLRMGLDLFIPRRTDPADESIGSFIRRRLGNEALEKIGEPLLSGIHVSDPERQSLLGTFPRFRTLEERHGSLIRGMLAQRRSAPPAAPSDGAWRSSAFVSLRGGMARLVSALEQNLTGGRLLPHTAAEAITPLPAGGYAVRVAGGETIQAQAIIAATPAYVSAGLVAPFAAPLGQALGAIRYVSTATASLAYAAPSGGSPLAGVGFIIPRREGRHISACTISSTKFSDRAPQGRLLLRCFVGGPGREQELERSDAEMIAMVRQELAELLGLRSEPLLGRVYRWPQGNAQYDVGHLERVRALHQLAAERAPGFFLTGSAYEGVGVPDCIHQGQQAAGRTLAYLQAQPEPLAVPTGA